MSSENNNRYRQRYSSDESRSYSRERDGYYSERRTRSGKSGEPSYSRSGRSEGSSYSRSGRADSSAYSRSSGNDSSAYSRYRANKDRSHSGRWSEEEADIIRNRRERQQKVKHEREKKGVGAGKVILLVVIIMVIVLGISAGAVVIYAKNQAKTFKSYAAVLKEDLKDAYECIKQMDPDGAKESIEDAKSLADNIRDELATNSFWEFAAKVPVVSSDIENAKKALDILDNAYDDLFDPMITQLETYPMSALKVDAGFNVDMVLSYLDFAQEVKPAIEDFTEEVKELTFHFVSFDLDEYFAKFDKALYYLDIAQSYDELLRTILGDGTEDKFYVLLAQNSAEVRACGGYPGSVGSISVVDGVMIIGEFESIYDVMYSMQTSYISDLEAQLFGGMYVSQSHDACYNPHFPRMAEITKVAYDYYNGTDVDGVISMTPAIVQGILQATGAEVELSDGTKFNGDNALEVIQRDIYLVYQGVQGTASANDNLVGQLFSEAASGALGSLTDNFGVDKALKYIELITSSFDDRTVMIWMADDEEEQVMYDYGASGALNYDENNPQTGVYVSVSDPSKLGIYFNMNVEVGEGTELSDGSYEYDVTVTLENTMTDDNTFGVNSTWVLGNYGRNITGYCYFFAPMGGEITDIYADNGMYLQWGQYEGLEVYYCMSMTLYWYSPVTVTYKVHTAAGVDTPLTVSSTPMLNFDFASTADLDLSAVGAYWVPTDEEYHETETATEGEETETEAETATEDPGGGTIPVEPGPVETEAETDDSGGETIPVEPGPVETEAETDG